MTQRAFDAIALAGYKGFNDGVYNARRTSGAWEIFYIGEWTKFTEQDKPESNDCWGRCYRSKLNPKGLAIENYLRHVMTDDEKLVSAIEKARKRAFEKGEFAGHIIRKLIHRVLPNYNPLLKKLATSLRREVADVYLRRIQAEAA